MQEDRLVQTFLDLIKIDSPSGHEEKVREYVVQFVEKLGLKAIQDARGNLIVKVDGLGEPLLLGAHLDTVEPGRNIKPQIKDGIIRSSGDTILGADNKAAIAAILEILKDFIKNKLQISSLDIVFTLSEENGEFGSSKLDYEKISAKKGYIFDNENPIGTVIISSPFYYSFNIKIIGKGVHASMPERGVNALGILGKALNNIRLGKINHKTIANIGIINGGHARNSIPAEIFTEGEVRSFIGEEAKGYLGFIIEKFKECAGKLGGKIEYSFVCESPGYKYRKNDELVVQVKNVFKSLNIRPSLKSSWACSDANIFNLHGIKTINLSEGIVGAHTINESVSVKNLKMLSKLIFSLVTPLHATHI